MYVFTSISVYLIVKSILEEFQMIYYTDKKVEGKSSNINKK
jgi:hypothetical protein